MANQSNIFSRYSDFAPPPVEKQPQQQGLNQNDFNVQPQQMIQPQQQVQQQSQSDVQQNEQDLYNGKLTTELGIDIKMILLKLKCSLPGTQVPIEVAQYPEMVYSFIIFALVLLLGLVSDSKMYTYIPIMFGTLIYGGILFKVLVSLILQGQKTVDFYDMLSAVSYSITPTVISWFILAFLGLSYNQFILCSIPSSIGAAFILQKHLSAIVSIENVKLLIIIPAFIFSSFWLLMGRGLAK